MAVSPQPASYIQKAVHSKVIQFFEQNRHPLSILITGKTGVGKSALVNGIVGKPVAPESEPGAIDPKTTYVSEYCNTIVGIKVLVYDSPGLQDGLSNEDAYLQDMKDKCQDVHLVLYCIKMTDMGMFEGDDSAMAKLSKAFGLDRFWQKAIFVLTFANQVKPRPPHREDSTQQPPTEAEHFKQRLEEWKVILPEALTKKGIKSDIAKNVPIIPAGYHTELSLPVAENKLWLTNLWCQCLNRTADSAKLSFLKINVKRLRERQEVNMKDVSQRKAYDQPIVLTNDSESLISKIIAQLSGLSCSVPYIKQLLMPIVSSLLGIDSNGDKSHDVPPHREELGSTDSNVPLDQVLDHTSGRVSKHLGQIADFMNEWEGPVSEALGLSPADVTAIKTAHPEVFRLQVRAALEKWKQYKGRSATYRNLIVVFEQAGSKDFADKVYEIAGVPCPNTEIKITRDQPEAREPITVASECGQKPQLATALKLLIPVAEEWQNIGTILELREEDLELIATHGDKHSNHLREMLNLWLSQDHLVPSWEALAEAVEPFNDEVAASLRAEN